MARIEGGDLKRILVVDDDPNLQEALSDLLESKGYEVTSADNGVVALDLLRKSDAPCLILLDLMMPVMDGHEFLARVTADSTLAKIPVVVVTAGRHPQGSTVNGAAEVLYKPFEAERLMKVVQQFCQ
jgi:CheY-like chemotaxis protein